MALIRVNGGAEVLDVKEYGAAAYDTTNGAGGQIIEADGTTVAGGLDIPANGNYMSLTYNTSTYQYIFKAIVAGEFIVLSKDSNGLKVTRAHYNVGDTLVTGIVDGMAVAVMAL